MAQLDTPSPPPPPPRVLALTTRAVLSQPRLPSLRADTAAPTTLCSLPDAALLAATVSGAVQLHAGHAGLTTLVPPADPPVSRLAATAARFAAARGPVVSIHALPSAHRTASFTLPAPVVALALQPSAAASHLAAATAHAISLYSLPTSRLLSRFPPQSAAPARPSRPASFTTPLSQNPSYTALAFSPAHANLLVAADDSGTITVFDIAPRLSRTESSLRHPATHARFATPMRAPTTALSFARPGAHVSLVAAGFDKTLRFFDPALRTQLFTIPCAAPITAVSIAPDARHVAVGYTTGTVQLLRLHASSRTAAVINELVVDAVAATPGASDDPSPVREVHLCVEAAEPPRRIRLARAPVMRDVRAAFVTKGPATPRVPEPRREEHDDISDDLDFAARTPQSVSKAPLLDSDIFSPLAGNAPSAGLVSPSPLGKSSSFHHSPRDTISIPRGVSFRTPRSRTVNDLTPIKGDDALDGAMRAPRRLVDEDGGRVGSADVGVQSADVGETDAMDSDSLDSIQGKSPLASKPLTPIQPREDVSQLQGSTVSDDAGHRIGAAHKGDGHKGEVSTPTRAVHRVTTREGRSSGDENAHSGKRRSDELSRGVPRSSSRGSNLSVQRGTAASSLANYRRLSAESLRRKSAELVTGNREKKRGEEASASFSSGGDAQFSETSSRSLQPSHNSYSPRESPGNVSLPGMRESAGPGGLGPEFASALAEKLRDVVSQELDAVRAEMRRDILNIHSELVVISAKHSEEVHSAFTERDRRVKQLEEEVSRLRADNDRLRTKYGLG